MSLWNQSMSARKRKVGEAAAEHMHSLLHLSELPGMWQRAKLMMVTYRAWCQFTWMLAM